MAEQLELPLGEYARKRIYEVYFHEDHPHGNTKIYSGHMKFLKARNLKDAQHQVAFNFARYWIYCGIREVSQKNIVEVWSDLKRQLEKVDSQIKSSHPSPNAHERLETRKRQLSEKIDKCKSFLDEI